MLGRTAVPPASAGEESLAAQLGQAQHQLRQHRERREQLRLELVDLNDQYRQECRLNLATGRKPDTARTRERIAELEGLMAEAERMASESEALLATLQERRAAEERAAQEVRAAREAAARVATAEACMAAANLALTRAGKALGELLLAIGELEQVDPGQAWALWLEAKKLNPVAQLQAVGWLTLERFGQAPLTWEVRAMVPALPGRLAGGGTVNLAGYLSDREQKCNGAQQ